MHAATPAAACESVASATAHGIEGVTGVASFPPCITQNPYQRLLYESLAPYGFELEGDARFKLGWLVGARRRVSVLHFHWPQGYYRHAGRPEALRGPLSWIRVCLFVGRLTAARLLGYRIAWTIHQVYPHETRSRRLDRVAARTLAHFSHVLIAHDGFTAERARAELGARGVEIVPHGSYIGVYPEGRPPGVVRDELGISAEAFVFLCFGHLRAYKDLGLLLEAFRKVSRPTAVLLVAGMGLDAAAAEMLRTAEAADPRIRSIVGFMPDERVAELFGACDAAVLARSDGGTSGSLILALSLGLPIVAANTPAYRELIGEDSGWLFEPGAGEPLCLVLEEAIADPAAVRRKSSAASRAADRLSWAEIGERTASLMRNPRLTRQAT